MSKTLIESIRENLNDPAETDKLLDSAAAAKMTYTQNGYYNNEALSLDRDTDEHIGCLLIEDKDKGPYYLFDRDATGKQTMKELSYNELLDYADPEATEKPEKPEMDFIDIILNVFGLSSKMNRYSREMEVYQARKAKVLEEDFGFKGLKYKKELLDEDTAKTYVKDNKLTKVKDLPEKQVTDEVSVEKTLRTAGDNALVTNPINNVRVQHKSSADLKKEVAGRLLTKITQINGNEDWQARIGAGQIIDLLSHGQNATKEKDFVITTLANMQTYITKNEFSNGKTVKDEIAQIYQNVTNLCHNVYTNTLDENMNIGSSKDVDLYLTNAVQAGNLLPQDMVKKYTTVPQVNQNVPQVNQNVPRH